MTRQSSDDRQVIENAQGFDFLVLDELHTYRGRQGADVAMLMRRVRNRLCRDHNPICIGTSATMVSESEGIDTSASVARVASLLFGADIGHDDVVTESLDGQRTRAGILRRSGRTSKRPLSPNSP